MKHPNKLLPKLSSSYHVNTRKICFPNGRFVAMSSINELRTKFCVIWSKLMKLHGERPVLTSQFDVSKLQNQLPSVIQTHLDQSANFGPLSTNACDSKPLHKSLKVTRNAANWNNYINEASKPIFANIFFKLSYNTRKVWFSMGRFVSLYSIYEVKTKFFLIWIKLMKLYGERPILTSQFDVSKLEKQPSSVVQTHLDQFPSFGLLSLNVCVTVTSSINR